MFCPNCGNQINDGARFCPFCGVSASEAPAPRLFAVRGRVRCFAGLFAVTKGHSSGRAANIERRGFAMCHANTYAGLRIVRSHIGYE